MRRAPSPRPVDKPHGRSPQTAPQAVRFRGCASPSVSDPSRRSGPEVVEIQISPRQTVAQAAASLVSALRARGAGASRSLALNILARAGAGEASIVATVGLWRVAVAACPRADDLTVYLGDDELGSSGLAGALPW